MSGIFKGDSIYKSGGGGGGYKDGGQLVDGDFIKVENNTVSSYDNVSRDPVNFYFEVKDGEVLNSVVELTTAVNATINVYVVKNGFYYLLGNVGGNTVNAGDDYKLNVTGDSYALEEVTPSSGSPEIVDINGVLYPLVNINGLLWATKNSRIEKGSFIDCGGESFFYYGNATEIGKLENELNKFGCRLPTPSDFSSLITFLGGGTDAVKKIRSTTGWVGTQGTNESGLNIQPLGYYNDIGGFPFDVGYFGTILLSGNVSGNIMRIYNDNNIVGSSSASSNSCCRFVIDI